MKIFRWNIFALIFLTVTLAYPAAYAAESEQAPAPERPAEWAVPIAVEGVPNLHKVSDTLYRSAQPTEEGFRNLKKLGIKTIVSLRVFHTDEDEIEDAGAEKDFNIKRISFKTWHAEDEDVVEFLKIVTDPNNAPVLVHCQHGADRTGLMTAIYRVAVQGWTKKEALREMTEGGYGFHTVWQNLPEYFEELDIAKIRKEAGLEK
jgi:protein tyrosine/serine phosphatase